MKAIKFIALLCFISGLFVSCESGPSQEDLKKLRDMEAEWASYLSNNYQEGDSIYFLRTDLETKETQIEGFLVKYCFLAELAYDVEDDNMIEDQNENEGSLSRYISGFEDLVEMRNKNDFITISLSADFNDEEHDYEIIETCYVYINNFSCDMISHHTIDNDLFTITTCAAECAMKRNTGLIQFCNDQYSWALVQ